ncbi:MAG: PadR family transcriptional regulator [Anaerolineales bacterium]
MTNAELAVLSLIAEKPRHGYDIEQAIEFRGMREWTEIGFSSIYYLLKKLEQEGLIKSQLLQQKGKGPARKVYSITLPGRKAQLKETIAALSTPQSGSSPFLLCLSNFPIIPREQALSALNSYAQQLEDRQRNILQRAEEQRPLPSFVEAMFDYSQNLIEAELDWIRKFIEQVEAGNV